MTTDRRAQIRRMLARNATTGVTTGAYYQLAAQVEQLLDELDAADHVRQYVRTDDEFRPGDLVEVRATGERGVVNSIHSVTAEVLVEYGAPDSCRRVIQYTDPTAIRKI